MSGIAGYLGGPQPPAVLRGMLGKMMHRGTEAATFYEEGAVFMGARQFPPRADAPGDRTFIDSDRDLAVMFAGDFYNFQEELEILEKRGIQFSEGSVAEIVLRLYEVYGVSCVNRMRGAFVFAIHDQRKDLVFIAHDQMGSKPLFYATTQSGTFVFASEIKSLFEHPGLQAEADLRGVDAFLTLGYSPGPDAMFKGVHKLPPGHRILWNPGLHVMIEPYWQWDSFAKPDPVLKSDDDFHARFATLFESAVREQAGEGSAVLLSGDIQSVAIAAVAVQDARTPLPAFCLDLPGEISAVTAADELGCKFERVEFGVHDMDKLPEAIWAMDEPVADISLVPFYLASRVMQKKSSAMLTGAGAAELFVSLPAQRQLMSAREKPKSLYRALKSLYTLAPQASIARARGFDGMIGPRTKQRLFDFVDALGGGSTWRQYLSIASVLDGRDKQGLYARLMAPFMETFADLQKDPEGWPGLQGQLLAMQQRGLADGILAPLEQASMFNSAHCRLPFTDPRLAEFLIGLPDHLRNKRRRDKILLRDYMAKSHPGVLEASIAPAIPVRPALLPQCLAAEPLKGMVETLLSEASVRRRELFEWQSVKTLLAGAKTGEVIYAKQVFALTMLELWFRIFIDHEKGWTS